MGRCTLAQRGRETLCSHVALWDRRPSVSEQGMALTFPFCQQSQLPGVSMGAPRAQLQDLLSQASPITLGLQRATDNKRCPRLLPPARLLGQPETPQRWPSPGWGVREWRSREGSGSQASASPGSNHWDRVGLLCDRQGLDTALRGSQPEAEIRLVQGLRGVERE